MVSLYSYSLIGKAFEKKKIKAIEDQEEKQIKPLKEHGKQLAESNAFLKNEYDSEID